MYKRQVLDGEDCINVSGNTITGLKAGTATVTLRVDSQMNDKTYDLYTAPVTITVEGQLMEGYAPVKTLNENLVSAPTVIADSLASLDDADALINDDVTSSVMLKVELEDGELVCYSGETLSLIHISTAMCSRRSLWRRLATTTTTAVSYTHLSVWVSIELVASSKIMTGGSATAARAMASS